MFLDKDSLFTAACELPTGPSSPINYMRNIDGRHRDYVGVIMGVYKGTLIVGWRQIPGRATGSGGIGVGASGLGWAW